MATEKQLEATQQSLERVQQFDAKKLARVGELGQALNFTAVVQPAQAVIDVYRRIPVAALQDFADPQLEVILGQANSDYQLFDTIMKFSPAEGNPAAQRQELINQVTARREAVFQVLWQFIAYGVARLTDTSLLETQARATIQGIKDQAETFTKQLAQSKEDADTALSAIRAVAAEQGVSQQASYFKGEADQQDDKAERWLQQTYWFAAALGLFAAGSLFLHRWEWLAPTTAVETFQFVTSKVLIFAVLAYLLLLSARNYATHKHNAVVNRHRQNALLTYTTLVSAAAERGTEDIVLAHAAACIFAPQETGYSGGKADGAGGSKSVLELLTKATPKPAE